MRLHPFRLRNPEHARQPPQSRSNGKSSDSVHLAGRTGNRFGSRRTVCEGVLVVIGGGSVHTQIDIQLLGSCRRQ